MRNWIAGIAVLASCVACWAEDESETRAKEALESFKKLYGSAADEQGRAAAVPALGDPAHPITLKALAALLVSDAESVRITAAETLRHFGGRKDVVPALASALDANAALPKVQMALLTTLGTTDDPAAAALLERYVKEIIPKRDRDLSEFAEAACGALGTLKWKPSVESLLDLLQRNAVSGKRGKEGQDRARSEIGDACRKALKKLLGTKNDNWREWKDWWQDNRAKMDDRLNPK